MSDKATDDSKRDLQNVLYQMYKSGVHTDVTIEVKSKETRYFKAHRLILATRSPVFADKFHGMHHSSLFTFVVEGVHPNTMEIFLSYIYSGCLSVEKIEEIVEFGKMSKYYKINDVRPVCKQALHSYIVNEHNVFSLLDACVYFRMKSLYSQCITLIQEKQDNLFVGSGFLSASQGTISQMMNQIKVTKTETMNIIFRWLNYNRSADRSMLKNIGLESLSAEELLNWIEEYPSFLKAKEALSILLNILRPGSVQLPSWYKLCSEATDALEEGSVCAAMTADTALRTETSCDQMFGKSSFHGSDGFLASMRMKLKSYSRDQLQLMMMELCFGTSYVPEDNLNISIFRHEQDFPLIKKIKVNFALQSTPENYYLVLSERISLLPNSPFHFTLEINVKGLKTWRSEGIVSDDRYRVMQVDKSWKMNLSVGKKEFVCLKSITNGLVIIDLKTGKKNFIIASLYFKCF